jgi:hypothetical protein
MLHISLHVLVSEISANETLGIIDSVRGIHGSLILGRISNESLFIGKSHDTWSDSVSLVIGNDLNSSVLVDTNA